MGVKKNFVVKNGIEVADNLIFAEGQKVGVNTNSPDYTLDTKGDIALSGKLYVPPETQPSSTTGTVDSVEKFFISGVSTSLFKVNDLIDDGPGGFLVSNTKVTSIGISSIGIAPGHTRLTGSGSITISINRKVTSGQSGQVLVSRGESQSPVWQTPTGETIVATSTTSSVRYPIFASGAGSTTVNINQDQLSFVPSTGNLGVGTTLPTSKLWVDGDVYVSGVVTSTSAQISNVSIGIGSTDLIVDGDLRVTGIATFGTSSITIDGNNNTLSIGTTGIVIDGTNNKISIGTDISISSGIVSATAFVGEFIGAASTAINIGITTLSTENKYYPTFATGIGSTSIGLTTSSLFIDPVTNNLGLGTDNSRYNLDIIGDLGFEGKIYAPTAPFVYASRSATVDGSNRDFVGINTNDIVIGDLIDDGDGGRLAGITTITSIGIGSVGIIPQHSLLIGSETLDVTLTNVTYITPGREGTVLVSSGSTGPVTWKTASSLLNVGVTTTSADDSYKVVFTSQYGESGVADLKVNEVGLTFNPSTSRLGINSETPRSSLDVQGDAIISGVITATTFDGTATNTTGIATGTYDISITGIASTAINVVGGIASVTQLNVSGVTTIGSATTNVTISNGVVNAVEFIGSGVNLTGIATNIVAGIGIDITNPTPSAFRIASYKPIGKTIFVSQTGNDSNTGLSENHPKRTIKAASAIAFPGDTIKVYPGVYVENNPIVLGKNVAVEGTELRNCVVTPRYLDRDLFHVNNSCHITDLSFVGGDMTNGAAIVALQPLLGVSTDRYFDSARMIRYNLDYIAAETVGYLTSTDYKNPAFVVVDGSGNPIAPVNCSDDIKDVMKAVIHDITRGGNLKCVGAGKSYFDDAGALLHITGISSGTDGLQSYSVKTATIDALNYAAGIARSCINNVSWNGNYQSQYSQIKDLAMQADPTTGSNEDIGSCANVVSAIYSCVGVVTTILDQGLSILGAGINTTFPANSGLGTDSIIGITSAVYDNTSGDTTLIAPSFSVKEGDVVEVRDLVFDCESSGVIGTQKYPSGKYGYLFYVVGVSTTDNSFIINTGVSTIPHNYVSGGFVVNRAIGVTTASYDNVTGVTTITAPGAVVKVGQFVRLHDLEFSCTSGAGTTTLYPTGNLGYEFRVTEVIGAGTTFVVNTGVSTIPHTYEGGGVAIPPYSPGVGPITQGPYIRNCTNFVPKSIGMKVDGFEAEPGDRDDIGVTGTMSVDSYTQYNQGGIGVSITNGAYSQLVSIFTICDDIAIFTGSGGQCDITNSNSSFGRLGLVADGVGDATSKSIYRYTGVAVTDVTSGNNVMAISGMGNIRPYDGQVCYFGELYNFVDVIEVTNGGSGYVSAPRVTISAPEGDNGITAQASSEIDAFGRVTAINLVNSGTQYLSAPTVTIDPPPVGVTATADVTKMQPIYYKVDSATLPSAGISTVSFLQTLNNTVSAGTTVYFTRVSLQITSSHSFEWVGSGNDINTAKPALGGVVIPENEVVQDNGGIVVYTSTDQAGNFKIGDGVVINQATGQISGRDFTKALFTTMTPFILALSE
jgi:hypothetical protein